MADTKLSDLTAITALATGDLLYVVDASEVAEADQSKRLPFSLVDARYASAAQGLLAATALQPAAIGVSVQAYAADLAAIAALAHADGNFIVGDGAAWVAESGATARASLGLGSAALAAATDFATAAQGALAATALQPADVAAMAYVADAPSDGSTYGRLNGAWAAVAAGVSLPVDDDTALVYRTGFAARTVTLDATALTAARVITLPDASFQPAALALANTFTAAQFIDGSADAVQLTVQGNAAQTNPVFVVETSAGADIFEVANDYKLSVRDRQILYVPDQTDFLGTLIFGNGGGSLSHTVGTEGQYNFAAGIGALLSITSGNYNIAIGSDALRSNTTGNSNTAIGANTLRPNTTGDYNLAIGIDALRFTTVGNYNAAIGAAALRNNTSGYYNMAIGANALRSNTTGYNNLGLGAKSLYTNTTGTGNVAVGYEAGYNETGSNLLYIANSNTTTPLIYGDFATGLLKFHTADAGTNTAPNTVSLVHLSSGGPLAGFGASLRYGLESSTTENQDAARLAGVWLDPTHASRTAEMVAYASDSAAEREIWRGRATGAAAAVGFLGQVPAVRQAHVADPAGGLTVDAEARTAINSILATLEVFGLHATV